MEAAVRTFVKGRFVVTTCSISDSAARATVDVELTEPHQHHAGASGTPPASALRKTVTVTRGSFHVRFSEEVGGQG